MALLIDGYNLIHAAGLLGRSVGPGGLERARQTLLQLLRASLPAEELDKTAVVFDAECAPRDLPHALRFHGISVYYSAGYDSADDLLAELIQADSAPRSLVVVSSDHAVQQSARRRRAKPIDSDVWLAETLARRRKRGARQADAKPGSVSAEELAHWLAEFGTETPAVDESFQPASPAAGLPAAADSSPPGLTKPRPAGGQPPRPPPRSRRSTAEPDVRKPLPGELENPFPPGYADDL